MSLDIWLINNKPIKKAGTGVFVRREGRVVELSAEEVASQFDGAEIRAREFETNVVFDYNITHNLTEMASRADLYTALWRPDEQGWTKAKDIVGQLERGLKRLKKDPEGFAKFNPANGWGSYDGLVGFVEAYLKACKDYPEAEIGVSR